MDGEEAVCRFWWEDGEDPMFLELLGLGMDMVGKDSKSEVGKL